MTPLVSPCPTDETLRAFGRGRTDQTVSDRVSSHLSECPACESRAAGLSGDSFTARLRAAQNPPGDPAVSQLAVSQIPQTIHPTRPSIPASQPAALTALTQYAEIRELGRGGMGVVYLAQNTLMGRAEVLKVINPAILASPGVLSRFFQEIQSAAKLGHKNVVAAYAAYQTNELLVLAMEYVPGEDLDRVVTTRGPLSVAHACFYAAQAALGLQHAHDRGMVHRDIKPGNLMLAKIDGKMVVKVLDFGLAKAKSGMAESTGLTNPGQMMGTPLYMAPEQAADSAGADVRADIYSLGCSLYFLLTGKPPFTSPNIYALLIEHKSAAARPLDRVRADVPPALAAVVAKMIAKEPADRFQTPGEVAKALRPFFNVPVAKSAAPAPVGTATYVPANDVVDAEVVEPAAAPPRPAGWNPPSIFRNQPLPNHTLHLNPDDYLPRPRDTAAAEKAPRRRRKPKRGFPLWAYGAMAVALAAAVAVAVIVPGLIRVKTPDGTLVIETTDAGADVFVDGEKVTVTWADGKTAEVRVKPGTHQVKLRKDGFAIAGETVTLERGGRQVVRVTLERSPAARFVPLFNGKNKDGWTQPDDTDGSWDVKDGKLVGRGTVANPTVWRQAVLQTDRADFRDFRVRLVYRHLGGTNGGNLFLRSKGVESGENAANGKKTNGISVALGKADMSVPAGSVCVIPPGFWKKLDQNNQVDLTVWTRDLGKNEYKLPPTGDLIELVAECKGNRIRTTVNGKLVRDLTDDRFAVGKIGLTLPQTAAVEVHSLEIEEPAPPAAAFVPLFNGRNIDGWADADDSRGTWAVEAGKLVGRGVAVVPGKPWPHTNLQTVRSDFRDVRVRVVYRCGGGALVLRSKGVEPSSPPGGNKKQNGVWVAMGWEENSKVPAGSVAVAPVGFHMKPEGAVWTKNLGKNLYDLPGTADRVELVVEFRGNRLRTTVNGHPVRDTTEDNFASGKIGLVVNTNGTVEIETFEIEELPPS